MKESKGAAAFRKQVYQIIARAVQCPDGLERMCRLAKLFELCLVAANDKRLESVDRRVLMQCGLLRLLHDDAKASERQLAAAVGLPRNSIRGTLATLAECGYLTQPPLPQSPEAYQEQKEPAPP